MEHNGLRRVSSSPHIRAEHTIASMMLEVVIALVPAAAAAVYFFGWRALIIMSVSVASSVAWEWVYNRIAKKPQTIGDLSAVVTGLLLAFNLPVTVPVLIPIIGSFLAIVLVKQFFGGIGANFLNPALAARAILMVSWVGYMTGSAFSAAVRGVEMVAATTSATTAATGAVDAVTAATPLAMAGNYSLVQLFVGQCAGSLGEVSKLALLVGGIYLIVRRIISWKVPVLMIATVFVAKWISSGSVNDALYAILSGGLFLGAFFMATDYATSPVTSTGRIIMGVGCGVLTFVIRELSPMPEGVSYAILIMNLAVPLIDRYTKPRVYGEVKRHA